MFILHSSLPSMFWKKAVSISIKPYSLIAHSSHCRTCSCVHSVGSAGEKTVSKGCRRRSLHSGGPLSVLRPPSILLSLCLPSLLSLSLSQTSLVKWVCSQMALPELSSGFMASGAANLALWGGSQMLHYASCQNSLKQPCPTCSPQAACSPGWL